MSDRSSSQSLTPADATLEKLMDGVQRTGQALLGHNTVRILPFPEIKELTAKHEAARQSLREYLSERTLTVTTADIEAVARRYDEEYRGGIGRGDIDTELAERLAVWVNEKLAARRASISEPQ